MSEQTDLIPMHSPVDETTPGFSVVRRGGYDIGQVDGHVAWLEDQLRETEEARDLAERQAEQARREAHQAQQDLETGRPDWDQFGDRIASILRLAEEEGSSIRSQRLREADELLGQARAAQGDAERQHANRMSESETEAQELLRGAQGEAQRIVAVAQQQAEEQQRNASQRLTELERQRDGVHAQLVRLQQGLAAALQVQLPADTVSTVETVNTVETAETELHAESR